MKANYLLFPMLILSLALAGCQTTNFGSSVSTPSNLSASAQIDRDVTDALNDLYADEPAARALAKKAKGILVFPSIVKGGFMFGAHYGTGALRKGNRSVGYYNSIAASYGLQAGIQRFGYVLFFMTQSALDYVDQSQGWEVGVGPSIVVVDAGMGKSLTTTTGKADVYAFIFDQRGLMAGLGLQGSKISKINP